MVIYLLLNETALPSIPTQMAITWEPHAPFSDTQEDLDIKLESPLSPHEIPYKIR